eukprot:NODE_550_length_6834_cov_0.214402.p1 type:complete len:450 gc:universal NODE_550_length_6834_cov_0.214402:2052-703(-)
MFFIFHVLGFGQACISDNLPTQKPPKFYKRESESVRLAFFGDSGADDPAHKVLQMIKDWGADAIVHLGDFDYEDNPSKFLKMINDEVPKIPYLAVIGNHDLPKWTEYQTLLSSRMANNNVACQGEYGVKMNCNVKGINILLSGVGTFGSNHEGYLEQELKKSDGWSICGWHKNQHLYQMGHKNDEVGYAVYDICREHGALIFTGHEHSYARTKVMKQFEHQIVASHDTKTMKISPGDTFAIVSGLGGRTIRKWENDSNKYPWWSTFLTEDNDAQFGAVLCEFWGFTAECVFKDIDRKLRDSFNITRSMHGVDRKYKICKHMLELSPRLQPRILEKSKRSTLNTELEVSFDLKGIAIDKVYSAYLQLYIYKTEKDSDVVVSIENSKYKISYRADIESGEVFNSINIKSILEVDLKFKIVFSTDLEIGEKDCYAPALVVQTDDCNFINVSE